MEGAIIFYIREASACPELDGKTFSLAGGGTLTPRYAVDDQFLMLSA